MRTWYGLRRAANDPATLARYALLLGLALIGLYFGAVYLIAH